MTRPVEPMTSVEPAEERPAVGKEERRGVVVERVIAIAAVGVIAVSATGVVAVTACIGVVGAVGVLVGIRLRVFIGGAVPVSLIAL
jgi:hypothetical protein